MNEAAYATSGTGRLPSVQGGFVYVVAAFSGTGKTEMARQYPEIVDLDSSLYGKTEGWVERYVRAIRFHGYNRSPVFVSTHPPVLQALQAAGVPFILAYPDPQLREEYRQRYLQRAGTGGLMQRDEGWFARLMMQIWDQCMSDLTGFEHTPRIVLNTGEYLSDRIAHNSCTGFIVKGASR